MEFMTEQNSYLVPFKLVAVPPGQYPHAEDQRWAEPDIGHAAMLMRAMATTERDAAARRGMQAQHDVKTRLSGDTVASALIERLETIQKQAYPCQ